MTHWKPFQFFTPDLVKEPASSEPHVELKKLQISCCTSGRGQLLLGDLLGNIHFVERDFRISYAFPAFSQTVSFLHLVKERNLLVTIGEESEEALVPTLKIWELSNVERDGEPELLNVIKLSKTFPACSLACAPNLSMIAVGLVNGTILLFGGDVLRERQTVSRTINHEVNVPVTGLFFHEEPKRLALFVVTTNTVSVYQITRDDIKGTKLDDKGCDVGCCVLSDEGELVIGRKEAIYFYNTMGIGPCMAFEGDRKLLSWFRNYCVSVEQAPSNVKFNAVTLYEPKNKFTAYNGHFEGVTHICSEWGLIFIFTKDGRVHQLLEKDTQTKLDTLFKRHLYPTAIELATASNYDRAAIIDIYRKYGDHVYGKGDFDGAIMQYIKTIGTLEPSYVIKKFLDAQRILNLTSYLQKLHEAGEANANHTTLLLNCYTKLKSEKELSEFISKPDLNFDVETAIKVCRQAQYYVHALNLAQRENEHNWYLKILLEDLNKPAEALKYIESLPTAWDAADTLHKYGKLIATALPEETLSVLKTVIAKLHQDQLQQASSAKARATMSGIPSRSAKRKFTVDDFIHIFVNKTDWLIKLLEFSIDQRFGTQLVYNTLLELYLRSEEGKSEPTDKEDKALSLLTSPEAQLDESHALVLCQIHNFKPGVLYLYEKMKLYNEIVQYRMDANEHDAVILACKKYGDKDPTLWVKALTYFANKTPLESCRREVKEVLQYIQQQSLLPPLQVIQILSQSGTATLGLIKEYISSNLIREQKNIDEDNKAIRQYREDTEKAAEEIRALRTGAVIFQQMKCGICQRDLDPPAVHFLCMHSFHLRCLGENENECPSCVVEIRNFENLQKTLQEKSHQHEEFFRQLEQSSDGFSIVAKYFGRGVFNAASSSSSSSSAASRRPGDSHLPPVEALPFD